jgi:hypothetical protein
MHGMTIMVGQSLKYNFLAAKWADAFDLQPFLEALVMVDMAALRLVNRIVLLELHAANAAFLFVVGLTVEVLSGHPVNDGCWVSNGH